MISRILRPTDNAGTIHHVLLKLSGPSRIERCLKSAANYCLFAVITLSQLLASVLIVLGDWYGLGNAESFLSLLPPSHLFAVRGCDVSREDHRLYTASLPRLRFISLRPTRTDYKVVHLHRHSPQSRVHYLAPLEVLTH